MQMKTEEKDKIFYGWWIVAACSIIIFFATSINFYSFAVFLKPLEAEFGWSRTAISSTVGLWALVYGFASPLVGELLHKYGARAVIAGSALMVGLCWIFLGRLTDMSQLYVLMFFSGIGTAGITLIPNQTLISNWFDKYRGKAMGIMSVGIGLGGVSMPPLANKLIELFNWRVSFFVLGLFQLAIIPIVLLLIRTKPSDLGLEPDGISRSKAAAADYKPAAITGFDVKQSIRTRSFWLLFTAFALLIFGESALTVHMVALLDDAGLSSQAATNYWALAVGVSAAGRLGFGVLSDRMNPKHLIAGTHALHGVALAFISIFFLAMGMHSASAVLPFSILYGLSLGGAAVLLPVVVARCFGLLHFGKVLGLLMSGFAIGVVGGPVVAGKIADSTGSYQLALAIFIGAFIVSAILVSLVTLDLYKQEPIEAEERSGQLPLASRP